MRTLLVCWMALVADVARLTLQPIKYVVVGSEHGDHTGGIAAFPAGVDSAAVMREEERNYRLALERVIAEGTRLHDAGTSLKNAPAGARFEPYDGWTRAANNAFAALKRVYMEVDGQVK